ncbi:ribonucleoside-diphosphate reductase subunit alpha [Paenibacillaceae bacterium]|nr:ribonucleoside-diphosphate reductase subunit alpha [Paenibacillaceae bacterium]
MQKLEFDEQRLVRHVEKVMSDFPNLQSDNLSERTIKSILSQKEIKASEISNKLVLNALDNITTSETEWTHVAARLYLKRLYKEAGYNRSYDPGDKYGSYYGILKKLGEMGIYSETILKKYTNEEIKLANSYIEPEKDYLFTYIGLKTLVDRYLAKGYAGEIYELPQERYLTIALVLMSDEEKEKRMELVKEAYWALSNQYMTVATPTFSNAGKSYGQLSSCFIDTIEDSLQGIYDSNTDIANLSKNSGGIGAYVGKIRSRGSDIKGFKNVSSGVIPWIRQLNNTAVSVDQLGTRSGSVAVYLDVWHKDIMSFLDLKLNNGDERQRAHDIFTAVCLPDLFMEQVEKRADWYLFDPHEVKSVMGWCLEDFFDDEKGNGEFRERYEECVRCNDLNKDKVAAIDIMKRIMVSQLETGTPYMFYRDTVNRANPNKHAGMIYSSNLCVEVVNNQSPTTVTKQYIKDGEIIIHKKPGDMVVCNLSSIHLGRAVVDNVLSRLIPIQMRMLDNVIDQNTIPVLQAQVSNINYRSTGMGTFSWNELLAIKGIRWESEEAVEFADKLYEEIAYYAIKASSDLAIEKGSYPLYKGSEWNTGKYFERRNYKTNDRHDWGALKKQVMSQGMRNGWLMAVAPNGSTALLANGTASIDPVFNKLYYEEKKNYKIPVTVPSLNSKTTWFYKSAHEIDQIWSVRQNAARQRNIDQSQSFNIYVKNDIKAKDLLSIHMTAWSEGCKTTYYVRSTSIDIAEACESCSS